MVRLAAHLGDASLRRLLRSRPTGRAGLVPLALRLAAGAVFVAFSIGKFTRHDAEAAAFDRYGLPMPEVATYLAGSLELGGGILLALGLLTRLAALGLALNMAAAIATAGRIDGGIVNLGLAPALLAAMLVLLWTGAGRPSVDGWLAGRLGGVTARP